MGYFTIVISIIVAFAAAVLFTMVEIPILKKKQAGQNIREDGPQSHLSKAGTPSMGGVAIILAVAVSTVAGLHYSIDTLILLAVFLLFGLVGFLDDYLKVIKKNNLGLRAYQKFGLQALIAVALAVFLANSPLYGTEVFIPFVNIYVDFGGWYIPFIIFTVLAMVNAVNLTDGLDGLASGVTAASALFFAITAMKILSTPAEIFSASILGACLGFLVFNKNPAKIFMGDTGSLALGGGITIAAIIMKMELLLPVVGFVYVAEVLSVCIQVASFKLTGKRVFKMSPLHHHFELSGMKEKSVVFMFWMAAVIFAVIGFIIVH